MSYYCYYSCIMSVFTSYRVQLSIGIVTGIIGFLSTMVALAGYSSNCYNMIDSSYGATDIDKQLGPAFFLLLVATLLKLVDVIAHSLVPTPKEGYFGFEDALGAKSIVI